LLTRTCIPRELWGVQYPKGVHTLRLCGLAMISPPCHPSEELGGWPAPGAVAEVGAGVIVESQVALQRAGTGRGEETLAELDAPELRWGWSPGGAPRSGWSMRGGTVCAARPIWISWSVEMRATAAGAGAVSARAAARVTASETVRPGSVTASSRVKESLGLPRSPLWGYRAGM